MPGREKEKVIENMNIAKAVLCNSNMVTPEMSIKIGQTISDALSLLKEQEAEAKWIYGEDKTGVDGWRCSECDFFEPWFYEFTDDVDFIRFYGHCPSCGRKMTSYTGKPTQSGV